MLRNVTYCARTMRRRRQKVGAPSAENVELAAENEGLQQDNAALSAQVQLRITEKFGAKSERYVPDAESAQETPSARSVAPDPAPCTPAEAEGSDDTPAKSVARAKRRNKRLKDPKKPEASARKCFLDELPVGEHTVLEPACDLETDQFVQSHTESGGFRTIWSRMPLSVRNTLILRTERVALLQRSCRNVSLTAAKRMNR